MVRVWTASAGLLIATSVADAVQHHSVHSDHSEASHGRSSMPRVVDAKTPADDDRAVDGDLPGGDHDLAEAVGVRVDGNTTGPAIGSTERRRASHPVGAS